MLDDQSNSSATHTHALWALGKGALENNEIRDARRLLERSVELCTVDRALAARVQCTLAVALSRGGHEDEAFAMLDDAEPHCAGADLARLHNQRGLMLISTGNLGAAHDELVAARVGLQAAGDRAAEARTLCNLGGLASMMGLLDEADEWFRQAVPAAIESNQPVVLAGTEGNLGYLASRRGDYPAALSWYERARAGFGQLDDVDASVATLESDYARTLLDAGLATEATEAAGRAHDSARRGGNQLLEAHCLLLLAESAQLDNKPDEASAFLDRVRALGTEASPVFLLAERLAIGITLAQSGRAPSLTAANRSAEIAKALGDAGWRREAQEAAIVCAELAIECGATALAREVLRPYADSTVQHFGRARADQAHATALDRLAAGDRRGARRALRSGLRALDEQRTVSNAVELQAGSSARGLALAELGTRLALQDRRPADVLRWADRWCGHSTEHRPAAAPADSGLLLQLRNTTGRRDAALTEGADPAQLDAEIRRLERRLSDEARTIRSEAPPTTRELDVPALRRRLGDALLIEYIQSGHDVWAVTLTSHRTRLFPLGPAEPLIEAVEEQGHALRGMADPNRSQRATDSDRTSFADASRYLGEHLLSRLNLHHLVPAIVVPTGFLQAVSWSALPDLIDRPFVIAASARSWNSDFESDLIDTGHADIDVGLIGGPGLAHSSRELDALSQIHAHRGVSVEHAATVDRARSSFESSVLLHVAAHGTFRSDNPQFSSLEFTDGPLNLFDIERLRRAPRVVVLAACEAGATARTSGTGAIGTTTALLRIGVRCVVAPSTLVSDTHTSDYMIAFHRRLAGGANPATALAATRSTFAASVDPADQAVAAAFAVYGNCFDPDGRSPTTGGVAELI